MARQVV
ncbi:hypothetical protein ECEC1850_4854, partial [Escherichia coli EC1850]